jgi:signal transduction histidine kinase
MTEVGAAKAISPKAPAKSGTALHFLMVEDSEADSDLITRELRKSGFHFSSETAQTAEQFRIRVRALHPDVVLADYNLGQWRGIESVEILRQEGLDIPVILVTGALGDTTAVECIKLGATDYVLKDSLAKLPHAIRRALHEQQLRKQRREAEEALAQKAKELARTNQDLEQFAYVASHDLQEPLRMVAAYTQLLAEKYKGKLDEQADKYIHYAVDGATRMQTLVQDLLAFSRSGRDGTEMSETDCNDVVQQALLNLEAAVRDSSAQVKCGELPTVHANSGQLRQVFQNLIGNAIKFRKPEPPIIQIAAQKEGYEWLFSVADNGIGISSDFLNDIFVIFHRLHTREEYPGNGIGLAICKRIIERHGGRIWVESEQGNGTTFKFSLPAQKQTGTNDHRDQSGEKNQTRSATGG